MIKLSRTKGVKIMDLSSVILFVMCCVMPLMLVFMANRLGAKAQKMEKGKELNALNFRQFVIGIIGAMEVGFVVSAITACLATGTDFTVFMKAFGFAVCPFMICIMLYCKVVWEMVGRKFGLEKKN